MTRKLVDYNSLESFWKKLNKWLQVNFDNLYQNDGEFEEALLKQQSVLDEIREKVNKLTSADNLITKDDVYIKDDTLVFNNLKIIN